MSQSVTALQNIQVKHIGSYETMLINNKLNVSNKNSLMQKH